MSDTVAGFVDPPPDQPAPAPVRKGHPVLAWLVIVAVIAFILFRHAATETLARAGFDRLTFVLQSRYLVGVSALLGQNDKLYDQAKTMRGQDYEQRLCFAVLAGELKGPEEALEQLNDLPDVDEADADAETADALRAIYRARQKAAAKDGGDGKNKKKAEAAAEPPADAVGRVRDKLGWFGDLAAAPPGTPDVAARARALEPAKRTALVFLAVFLLVVLAALAGMAALVTLAALSATGMIRPRFTTGSPFGGVYAETFALWMVVYLGMSYAASYLPLPGSRMLISAVCMFVSLAVLAWPVARGVPWSTVRADVGLGLNRGAVLDVTTGFATYLAAIPLLIVGVIVTAVAAAVAKRLGLPSAIGGHPLAPFVSESGWWGRAEAILAASVVAPIVEETMFRGVLYRHLREGTAGTGRVASVLASSLAVCFVFAVIHPQGWFGVPPLMALAFSFCLAREYFGGLLPAMVAHFLQNTLVTAMVILAAG